MYYYNGLSTIDIVGDEHFNKIIFLIILISFSWRIFFKKNFDKNLSMNFNNDNIIIVIIINAIVKLNYIFSIILINKKSIIGKMTK